MHSALVAIMLVIVALVVVVLSGLYRIYRRGHYGLWIPSYIKGVFAKPSDRDKRQGPLHIVFVIADHFEPGHSSESLVNWLARYRAVVSRHHDSFGNPPKRSLHFPIEQFYDHQIELLLQLCRDGFAEIEMQLHHFDDNSQTVLEKYQKGLSDFARFGISQTIDDPSQTRFAFVHGNWALDNSAAGQTPNPCGVNDEIRILASLGCFVDVTFSSVLTTSQPRRINSIYYVTDDPQAPKSYDDGVPVEVGKAPSGDLMLLQGPLLFNWRDWRYRIHPAVENGDIWAGYPLSPRRIPLWLKANIHVLGQPNWVFVKLHAHGCRGTDLDALTGDSFDQTLSALESTYDDGKEYVLHYASVREAYNIIKAAEAGKTGNPEDYRDFVIKPYRANQT
ncbi:MAG: hypothetical protein E4G91_08805 [Candidatus Zixiibacteriota bacterium]|nr:MAG: hypothetical protein E4G91_08805 [candidate division Zixibacteria bacterium]